MTARTILAGMISWAVLCMAPCLGEQAGPSPGAEQQAKPVERPVFVTLPPQFKTLKRAPVLFKHDKHVEALKSEGCAVCHSKTDGKFDFGFPKQRDDRSPAALMDSYHNACVGCHSKLSGKRKKSGPEDCGGCHSRKKAYGDERYVPVSPDAYSAIRDPYHKDCIACHRTPEKSGKNVKDPDWKKFYVKEKTRLEVAWPEMVYDYYLHDKHQKALDKKCDLCHYLSPERRQKLSAEGKEPSGQDWLMEEQPGQSWSKKESAHSRCLNCHLARDEEKKPHGPVNCKDCHQDRPRTAAELAGVHPPDYGGKENILVAADGAAMAAVPFDHKLHIAASRSCGDCHHDTLASCKTCHPVKGIKEGKFITLAEAYHMPGSGWSCVGCHEREQKKQDCAGCHDLRKGGLSGSSCTACHSGKRESGDQPSGLPDPAALFPKDLKDEFQISVLENEYGPAGNKHTDIARKLTEISNKNRLARFFHKDQATICMGCHHMGPVEKGGKVPACGSCHTVMNEPSGNTPTLLGAYHQACLGCHKAMGYPEEKMPQKCDGCHKEKPKRETASR